MSETPAEALDAEELVHHRRSYPLIRVIIAILLGLAVLSYIESRIQQP